MRLSYLQLPKGSFALHKIVGWMTVDDVFFTLTRKLKGHVSCINDILTQSLTHTQHSGASSHAQ